MLTRRQFLKVGIGGAAVLAAAKLVYDLRPPAHPPASAPPLPGADARDVVAALVPVVLAGALPAEEREAVVGRVSDDVLAAIAALPPAAQAELGELFALLSFAPSRFLLAGVRGAWRHASATQVHGFLERWRSSRFKLLQAGYHALNQLILAAWYANPKSWPATGYTGPPHIR